MYWEELGEVVPLLLLVRALQFAGVVFWALGGAHLVTDCICCPLLVLSVLAAAPQQPYQRCDFPIDAATMSVYY